MSARTGRWEVRDGQAVRICRFVACDRVTRHRGGRRGWEALCEGHRERVVRLHRGLPSAVELESAILGSWQASLRARGRAVPR